MKKVLSVFLLLLSTMVFAAVTKTSSENVNPYFVLSDAEIRGLGENMRGVAREEMGKLYKYSCMAHDDVVMKCTYRFELPEDYCWYGTFEANAEYELLSTGAKLISADVEWSAEY